MKQKGITVLRRWLISEQRLRDAMELYPGKTRAEVQELVFSGLLKKLVQGMELMVFLFVIAFLTGQNHGEESGILRPAPGTAPITEQLFLQTDEGMQQVELVVAAREYTEAEIEELHAVAVEYLEKKVLGDNEDFSQVVENLYFPSRLPDVAGNGSVDWSTDAPWIVGSDGTVLNEALEGEEIVTITAKLTFGIEVRYFTRTVTVCPKEYFGMEAVRKEAEEELCRQEQDNRNGERFELPEVVLGYPLVQKEQKSGSMFFVLVAFLVPLYLYSSFFSGLDTKRKQRKEQAENGYVEFVTKLSLLLAAGVSVRQVFFRLAEEYEQHYGETHVLAAELKVTKQELENGGSEAELYEAFGRRLGVLCYQRLASLLTQNVSKGVQGIQTLLLQEAKEVMAQEQANIRVKGEQAGTKLLLPMMGLLFLVFAILLVPAFQSF